MKPQVTNEKFGAKIAAFPGRSIMLRTWMFLFLPSCLLIFSSYLYGMLLARDAYQNYGPVLAFVRSRSWFIFATVMLVLLTTYLLYRLLIALRRIEIFDNGIRYRSLLFRQHAYNWSEISGISSSATKTTVFGKEIRTIPTGEIYLYNGKSIHLTNRFQNLPRLVQIVKSKIYPLIWPTLKSLFRTEGSAQFGRLKIMREHLQISKLRIPWTSIERIWVDSGYLVVKLHGDPNQYVPISNIPNLELLLKFVDWGIQK